MIILEGIDGTGKTTIADFLEKNGMKKFHYNYDPQNTDLENKYISPILNYNNKTIMDRSFISELVYGPVIRNSCRINKKQLERIIEAYTSKNIAIIYLTAEKNILLNRRKNNISDYQNIENYYEKLNQRYEMVMNVMKNYFYIEKIDTSKLKPNELCEKIEGFINERYNLYR